MAVERLDLLRENSVAGILAQEHEELADSIVDQSAAFGFGRTRRFIDCLSRDGWLELFDGVFHHPRGDLPTARLLCGLLPGRLRLLEGKSSERSELPFVVRFLQGATGSQMRKHLGGKDDL